MCIYRLLVLNVTYYLIALVPNLDLALVIFAGGTAVYASLWYWEIHSKRKQK